MAQYKVITTLTWKFESDDSHQECLEHAKRQLDQILDTNPLGDEFDGFSVQVDIAGMKQRKRLVHLGEFDPEEVFPYVTVEESKRDYRIGDQVFQVRMNSDRYAVFRANRACVACGIVGTKMILDINPGDQSPHFNLYAVENGRYVLMTKDHILAKSKGGLDVLSNYQTCCSLCNNLKGNYDLSPQQMRELRQIYNNEEKLPKKELRDLINKTRDDMVRKNQQQEAPPTS